MLVTQPVGQFRLLVREIPLHRISCPLWAPLIDINDPDLKITGHFGTINRYDLLKDREVGL